MSSPCGKSHFLAMDRGELIYSKGMNSSKGSSHTVRLGEWCRFQDAQRGSMRTATPVAQGVEGRG